MESFFSPDNMNVFMSVIIAIYATTIIAPMLYFCVDLCMHRRTDDAAAGSNAHGVAAPLPTDGYELEEIRVDASSGEPGALPVLLCESSSSANADYCAVCLGEMEEGELGRMLPTCLHVFHIGCIDAWLRRNPTCPICRMAVRMSEDTVAGGSSVTERVPIFMGENVWANFPG